MRVLVALGLLLAGAATGIATVALHSLAWGLLLGLAATGTTVLALPPGWSTRLAFVLGWDGLVGWLTLPRADGGYLISSDASGYALLGTAVVLLVVGIATLPRPRALHASSKT